MQIPPRQYNTVQTRPITQSGIMAFGQWIQNQSWPDVYEAGNVHEKAQIFQNILLESYNKYFPVKEHKVSSEDKAWIFEKIR